MDSRSVLWPGSDTVWEGGSLEPRWVWGLGQAAGGLGVQRVGVVEVSGRWEMWDGQEKGPHTQILRHSDPHGDSLPYV